MTNSTERLLIVLERNYLFLTSSTEQILRGESHLGVLNKPGFLDYSVIKKEVSKDTFSINDLAEDLSKDRDLYEVFFPILGEKKLSISQISNRLMSL